MINSVLIPPPPVKSSYETLADSRAYAESCSIYREKADRVKSESLILAGYGAALSVKHGALSVKQGATNGQDETPLQYHRGVHSIRQIVILSNSGNISLDALYWCRDEGITLLLLDGQGNIVHSIVPEMRVESSLRRLQYEMPGKKCMQIAKGLVKMKVESQIDLLEKHPELPGSRTARFTIAQLSLSSCKDMDSLRKTEGLFAVPYYNAFVGHPLQWQAKDRKTAPDHWQQITERLSPLSHHHGARHAVNPFHAAVNYVNAVTCHQVLRAINIAGFDPACGILHVDKLNRQSLVYDLFEPLRAKVDSNVLKFFANTLLKKGDCVLKKNGGILFNAEFIRYLVASCSLPQTRSDEMVAWFRQKIGTVGKESDS